MKQVNDNLEIILYSIVEELSKENAPIIFKGALALKDLLYINNPNLKINRKTSDIDANWIEEYDEEKIIKLLDGAIKKVNSDYSIELYRKPKENVSMGINILDENKHIVSKIDMDIKNNPFYVVCTINDVEIKYSNLNKMMCDKLLSLSGGYVFRRAKDLLDVYLIINDNIVRKDDIDKVLEYEKKNLGDFSTLFENKEIARHSYNKLKNIDNKPEFDIVWNKIIDYLKEEKFIDNNVEKNNDIEIEK